MSRAAKLPESGTVTVACNLPNGLILELYDFEDHDEPVMGGGVKTVKKAVKNTDAGEIRLHGPALAVGQPPRCLVVGGYALTTEVDAQFFAKWLKQNERAAFVKNGCVFAYADTASATDAAKDHRANRSGLEPLTTGTDAKGQPLDPRLPRSRDRHITAVDAAVL